MSAMMYDGTVTMAQVAFCVACPDWPLERVERHFSASGEMKLSDLLRLRAVPAADRLWVLHKLSFMLPTPLAMEMSGVYTQAIREWYMDPKNEGRVPFNNGVRTEHFGSFSKFCRPIVRKYAEAIEAFERGEDVT